MTTPTREITMPADTLFADELIGPGRGLAHGARLLHPFLHVPISGGAAIWDALRVTYAALDHEVVADVRFAGQTTSAVAWRGRCDGRPIRGLTMALLGETGEVVELRVLLCEFAVALPWRARLRERLPGLPGWELTPEEASAIVARVTDPSWQADTVAPFELSEQIRFFAPAFSRPIEGPAQVGLIIRNAVAVYGVCESGELLRAPAHVLRAKRSTLPMAIATILHVLPDGRADEVWVFMQAWPVISVFRQCLRARLADALDASFYELSGVDDQRARQERV